MRTCRPAFLCLALAAACGAQADQPPRVADVRMAAEASPALPEDAVLGIQKSMDAVLVEREFTVDQRAQLLTALADFVTNYASAWRQDDEWAFGPLDSLIDQKAAGPIAAIEADGKGSDEIRDLLVQWMELAPDMPDAPQPVIEIEVQP